MHEVDAIAQHVEAHAQVHAALDHEVRRIEDHADGRRVEVAQQLEGQRRARDDRAEMDLEQRLDPGALEPAGETLELGARPVADGEIPDGGSYLALKMRKRGQPSVRQASIRRATASSWSGRT